METWSDGIALLGRYNQLGAGCWLLRYGDEGAIVDMPPYDSDEDSPAAAAAAAAGQQGLHIKYLLSSHCHGDHISKKTFQEFEERFTTAEPVFHKGYRLLFEGFPRIRFFTDEEQLTLGGEPLFLVHAPKHSWTDTMIVFRGACITGDWELNTIRSVYDDQGSSSVPGWAKRQSIEKLIAFVNRRDYAIHKVFAAHANDHLKPGQVVPASGTMAFLLQLGQFFGILTVPNLIQLADGRGLQLALAALGIIVMLIALARRMERGAPEETGEVVPTGVIGMTQPGMMQADAMSRGIEHDDRTGSTDKPVG